MDEFIKSLPRVYLKIRRSLNQQNLDNIIEYIKSNSLFDQTIMKFFEDIYNCGDFCQSIVLLLQNYCNNIYAKNSCLISTIIAANILYHLNIRFEMFVGTILFNNNSQAHAWLSIENKQFEVIHVIKTYRFN